MTVPPEHPRSGFARWEADDALDAHAAALLIDYVLTVSVSVVAGMLAITSAAPELVEHKVIFSIGIVASSASTFWRPTSWDRATYRCPTGSGAETRVTARVWQRTMARCGSCGYRRCAL